MQSILQSKCSHLCSQFYSRNAASYAVNFAVKNAVTYAINYTGSCTINYAFNYTIRPFRRCLDEVNFYILTCGRY